VSAPPLSVVLPLHRTAGSLDELLTRLVAVCPEGTEYVLVDDACPEDSGGLVLSGWAHLPGRLLRTRANIGQLAAVQAGLRASTGELVAVLDADLQDAPEDLSTLLATLEADPADAVCAGRSGHYARGGRELTARLYRRAVTVLSLGRVPAGAGLFSVLSRHAVDRVVALDDHAAPLVPALARARLRIRAVPVQRRPRPRGRSATGSLRRSRIAAAGLVTLTPLHPVVRRLGPHRRLAPDLEVVELGLVPSTTSSPIEEP
jgi:dolichol-phosphate mannosyltransferase